MESGLRRLVSNGSGIFFQVVWFVVVLLFQKTSSVLFMYQKQVKTCHSVPSVHEQSLEILEVSKPVSKEVKGQKKSARSNLADPTEASWQNSH